MDITEFLTGLLAIILIDLALAGDNAIVIALAARNLPEALRRRAVLWGSVGAVLVRSLMTLGVVWLLQIPGLLLLGGAALVWIAWKLLQTEAAASVPQHAAAYGFWAAMRTIVVADAMMGLENVLAVAGAAQGNYLLVVLGLVISVPIVVFGSTLVLGLVERWPALIYLGAAALLWTAATMMAGEPAIQATLQARPLLAWLPYLVLPLVLGLAWLRQRRFANAADVSSQG